MDGDKEMETNIISELHIHKILYFLYGAFYKKFNIELFSPNFQAWKYGPVEVNFRKYFKEKNKDIIQNLFFDESKINFEQKKFINDFCKNLLKYSPWSLVEISHNSDPWKNNFDENTKNKTISNKEIQIYFKNHFLI